MKLTVLFVALLISTISFAQQPHINTHLPNRYRSKSNPYYWKNRKPNAAYWQQDVFYKIDATLDETTDIISGDETLRYWNNSPDTLYYVYFHLYQQAFVKGGHVENLNLNNNFKQTWGHYEKQGLGCNVLDLKIDGATPRVEQDLSVMKVYLPKALLPNDSMDFKIAFKTYYDNGSQRRRMKMFDDHGSKHYDGVHWYPRICVYDRKMGWDTQQHLGKEFYGDFGTFQVSLNMATNYVLEGTGTLQNEDDVLPKELRQKLDLSNFASKPWNSAPSVVTPYVKGERKTWKYYAENVHDFAFTADPNYRIGEVNWQGIRVVALAQESHAMGWQDAALFTMRLIQTYSWDFGMYGWQKIVVADAQDGMEYPMLTLDGGYAPNYYDLLAHEVGHMWFFGQVGNNETYRAFLDEGFTQFIESWSLEKIIGKNPITPRYRSGYVKHFSVPVPYRDGEVYLGYLNDAVMDNDERINQHSDAFNGALNHGGGYRHVYFKTGTMLWNLQYVLGDSLFQSAMQHYFNQWKFCHPYPEDFRASIIQFTHVDLNWFFDEWIESTKKIDYKVCGVKKTKGKKDSYDIKFKRLGRMEMPLDVMVVDKKNDTSYVHIPNNWFIKNLPRGWSAAPKWYGWDKLHPTYTLQVQDTKGIKNVVIDPSHRLADINELNNSLKCPVRWRFDSQISNAPDRHHYIVKWRPDVWYNAIDGIKAGLHFEGDYMKVKHVFSLTAWYNTGLLSYESLSKLVADTKKNYKASNKIPINFNFTYTNPSTALNYKTRSTLNLHWLDGLAGGSYRWDIQLNANNTLGMGLKSMYRPRPVDELYPLFQNPRWWSKQFNNTMRFNLSHRYAYIRGTGKIDIGVVSTTVKSSYKYSYANITAVNRNHLGKFDFNTRVFGQYASDFLPDESALYMASANPEEMYDNKFTRSRGIVPDDWVAFGANTNHFQYGGGLNLRGYNGYYVTEQRGNETYEYLIYKRNSGAAFSAELDFDRLIPFKPKLLVNAFHLDTYLFTDAGVMGYVSVQNKPRASAPRVDAGIGTALTIKHFWVLEEVNPLTIRFDMPLFINHPPFAEENYFKFRWLLSIDRAF